MNKPNSKRTCPVCDHPFQGRRDKRFCSDQCRATFNNEKKRETEQVMQSINSILRKNRRILKSLNPRGSSKVRVRYLKDQGFDFRYFTTYYVTSRSGVVYFFCYEFGYTRIEKEKLLIVNWQDYMDRFENVMPDPAHFQPF